MNISKQFLSINNFSRPGRKLTAVRGIVIHWVANPASSAQANRDYFESLKNQTEADGARYASAHYIVGLRGEVIQCLPDDEAAYHVGALSYRPGISGALSTYPNNCTIGIELCHPDLTGKFNADTYGAAVELSAVLLRRFSLNPQKDLYRHFDVTGKLCPKYFVENPSEWNAFRSDVEKYLIGIL